MNSQQDGETRILTKRSLAKWSLALWILAAAAGSGLSSPAHADVLIDSFETSTDLNLPLAQGASLFRSPVHSSEGDWSAQVTFDAVPGAHIHFDTRTSWWGMSGLAFFATTEEDNPVALIVTIHSPGGSLPVRVTIKPGRDSRVVIPCDAIARGHIDNVDRGAYSMAADGDPILLTSITGFDIGPAEPAGASHVIYLDDVKLIALAEGGGPVLVDDYGQYAPATWPGKVAQDESLQVDAAHETVPPPAIKSRGLDRFGGTRGAGLRQSAFFTVQKTGGRWRLVDPLGNPVFLVGVNGVDIDSAAAPPGPDELYTIRTTHNQKQDFYRANLELKFGDDYQNRWLTTTAARVKAWGFNAVGPGSASLEGLLRVVDAGQSSAMTGVHHLGPFPDVFDPAFPASAAAALRPVAGSREDPMVIGYTFDHALPWDRLLDPAFVAAQGGPAADYLQSLTRQAHPDQPLPQAADMQAFLASFADRYFKGIAAALRGSDHGHHLYLGCRFTVCPPAVIEACARSADVLTFDAYGASPESHGLGAILSALDRPALISAFSFGSTDRGLLNAGLSPVASQSARAAAYIHYLDACRSLPSVTGCLWERYLDEPVLVGSRPGANLGLVTITDRPYPELLAACREANPRASETPVASGIRTAEGIASADAPSN